MYKCVFQLPKNKKTTLKFPEIQDFLFTISSGYYKQEVEGFWENEEKQPTYEVMLKYTTCVSSSWAVHKLKEYLQKLNEYLKESCIYLEISPVKVELI